MIKVVGIDYSLTSPAICVHEGNDWCFNNCSFYYFVKNENLIKYQHPFYGSLYPEYEEDVDRFDQLTQWSCDVIKKHDSKICYIEGYAFGAVGRVFQIAENAGLLKHALWKLDVDVSVVAPTMIKKFATQKGNANKEMMYEFFFRETSVDIREKIGIIKKNQWNPISDIVDAYYIAKYGFNQEKSKEK